MINVFKFFKVAILPFIYLITEKPTWFIGPIEYWETFHKNKNFLFFGIFSGKMF